MSDLKLNIASFARRSLACCREAAAPRGRAQSARRGAAAIYLNLKMGRNARQRIFLCSEPSLIASILTIFPSEKLLLLSVSTDQSTMFITHTVLILIFGGSSLGSGENKILTPRASLKSETSYTDTDLYPVLDDTYFAAGTVS